MDHIAKKSKNYRKHKSALRKEFSYSCSYCNIREPELGGSESFWIDHYRPKSKFPHLINDYNNLLYSCRICNRTKGNYWPNFAEELFDKIVLNPRNDAIDKHINKASHNWKGNTKQGAWNIEFMKLSSPSLIKTRKDREKIQNIIYDYSLTLRDVNTLLEESKNNSNVIEISEYERMLQDLEETISILRAKIEGPLD